MTVQAQNRPQDAFPAAIREALETYCANNKPVSRDNDLSLVQQTGEQLMDFIQSNPEANMAATLDAVKEGRGEVRRLLKDCIEHEMYGAISHQQAVLLQIVLSAQGDHEMGILALEDSTDHAQEAVRIKRNFTDAVKQAQTVLPNIGYKSQINESGNNVRLQLGLTYSDYKLQSAYTLAGLPTLVEGMRASRQAAAPALRGH